MGVKKKPTCKTTAHMNCTSLYLTFNTDKGKEIPRTRTNSMSRTSGRKMIVAEDTNRNAPIKIPKTISSKHSIRKDVNTALMAGISLGK